MDEQLDTTIEPSEEEKAEAAVPAEDNATE